MSDNDPKTNPYQAFYEWQVTTLMLAHDLAEPIPASQPARIDERRERVYDEVQDLVRSVVPREYFEQETLNWPPELMMNITRATLRRAAELAGV